MCIKQMDGLKEHRGYIYKITNIETQKVYIGQTRKTVLKRFKQHLAAAFKSNSSVYNSKLSRSIRKHGTDRFIVEQIKEIISTSLGILCQELDKEERFYISFYKSTDNEFGYNISSGGQYRYYTAEQIELSIRTKTFSDICIIPGCNNPHHCNGLCNKHDTQMRRRGYILERTIKDLNEIVVKEDFAEIILYDKECNEVSRAIIDKEDIDLVKDIKWYLYKCTRGQYVRTNGPIHKLHNLIMKPEKDQVVIHINKNGLDNRKQNLKVVSQTEKQQNNKLSSNNTSGHKGVWFCKDRNKWQAQITINNKQKNLGRYNTFEEAVAAREAAEKVYYNKW